ncbi:hypothetical protein [Streptomyces sp. NPDC055709]
MGIESDQLVFDYLSRVGDLAQQRQLPSGTRMQLVSSLRNEIDRQRAKYGTDSPAAVQRILGRLGSPDEVVDDAATGPEGASGSGSGSGSGFGSDATAASVPEQRSGAAAGDDLLGDTAPEPDWWRIERTGQEPGERVGGFVGGSVGGFVGGVEIPDLLTPPRPGDAAVKDADKAAKAGGEPDGSRRRWRLRSRRGGPAAPDLAAGTAPDPAAGKAAARVSLGHPMPLFAATLLAVGAILGSLIALAGGWLLAYATRALSRTEAKWAVLGLPGLVALSAAVWLWGRLDGRWGDPIAPGGEAMGEALAGTWPWAVRAAAVASALFLIWRARRR